MSEKDFRKLSNHPLMLVLAEVRYSPLLNLPKYIPEIHDKLRSKFPSVKKVNNRAINIKDNSVDVTESERLIFLSSDSQSLVDISTHRALFITTIYDRFDGFSQSFREIINAIETKASPSSYERVGLRYCDSIVPNENENENAQEELSKMISSDLMHGDSCDTLGQKLFFKNEMLIQPKSDDGRNNSHLVIRSIQAITDFDVPEDLINIPLNIEKSKEPKLKVILDFDHFWQDKQNVKDFTSDNVIQTLSSLHDLSREAFWCVTTEYARNDVWQ